MSDRLKKTWCNWVTLWSNYFVTFFFASARTGGWPRNEGRERCSYYKGFIISQGEGCREDVRVGRGMAGNTSKVRKITNFKNLHHLGTYPQWAYCILLPEGREKNGRVQCPWGFSCFFFGGGVDTSPRPPVSARPNKYSLRLSLHRLGFVSWVTVRYLHPRGGTRTAGLMPPGLLLVYFLMVTCPRPPVFARPNKYSSQTFALLT